MFSSTSMAGTGLIVLILGLVLKFFGVTVGNEELTAVATNGAQIVGFVMTIWGQLRRPDLNFGLIRKK